MGHSQSDDGGSVANGGSSEHRNTIKAIGKSLSDLTPMLDPSGREGPDMTCSTGGQIFETDRPVWIEIETTTVSKPASIIKRIPPAQAENAKLVYAVQASEDEQTSGRVDALRRILTDPPLVKKKSVGRTDYYTDTARLLTANGEYVAARREELLADGAQGWWQNHETNEIHRKIGTESVLTLRNTAQLSEGIPESKAPYRVGLAENADETYRITDADGSERLTGSLENDLLYIKQPIIPDALDIDVEQVLDDIELLIVTEGDVYKQSLLPPADPTKVGSKPA